MSRLSFAFVAVLVAGCGGSNTGGGSSICSDPNAPASCGQTCDATPGAANTCGAGSYCNEDGSCDSQCSTDDQCGEGVHCTTDGRCESNNGGGGDDDPGPDAPGCPAVNFTPVAVTPSIMLVLDGSKSMDETLSNNTSKYNAMRTALTGASGVVTALQSKAYVGAGVYECGGSTVLKNPVARARDNATAIDTYLGSLGPSGSTPTPQALTEAKNSFTTNPPPAGSPPVIVLATDGEPNSCTNNHYDGKPDSIAAATAAYAAGIPVYVLAINTGASTHFQDLANAGQGHQTGQPNVPYYPVASAADLQSAFQTIINGVISCDLTLSSSIDDSQANQGTVTVNGTQLTYGTDWTLVNGNTIHLQGTACTNLKNAVNPSVNAQFPCGSVIF
jgi:hypothetical protein